MDGRRFRMGVTGLQPRQSWAARAHIPALRALADDFEIANTSHASARRTAVGAA